MELPVGGSTVPSIVRWVRPRGEKRHLAAFDVLARLGDDPPHLDLLRSGENAIHAFRERGLVLRVARPETEPAKVRRTVEFVTALAGLGMEVAEPVAAEGLVQPVAVSTGVVSLWRYYGHRSGLSGHTGGTGRPAAALP